MQNSITELKKKVEELGPWFQNIKLGQVQTNPAKGNYPQEWWDTVEQYIPKDLSGQTALELGCNGGFYSIKMKERGADVVAVDMIKRFIDQAKFVSEYYGMKIDFKYQNIYDFVLNTKEKFDYVICVGVFYHLKYPLLVLDRLADITKKKLIFHTIIKGPRLKTGTDPNLPFNQKILHIEEDYPGTENKIFSHPNFPKAYFIEKKFSGGESYWWILNQTGILAVLRTSGFKNVKSLEKNFFICEPNPDSKDRFIDTFTELD